MFHSYNCTLGVLCHVVAEEAGKTGWGLFTEKEIFIW